MVRSSKRQQEAHNIDITDLATLVMLGYHEPKKFSKAAKKFRKVAAKATNREKQQIKQEAEALGVRVPV